MKQNEKFVITLNRELGSDGRSVGRKLAERLNVKYYDKAVIEGLTKKFGVSGESVVKSVGDDGIADVARFEIEDAKENASDKSVNSKKAIV